MESVVEIGGPRGDVIADQAHALDAIDATFRWLVGVPTLELSAGGWFDAGLSPEDDDDVDVTQQLRVNGFGCVAGDVDADFGEALRG